MNAAEQMFDLLRWESVVRDMNMTKHHAFHKAQELNSPIGHSATLESLKPGERKSFSCAYYLSLCSRGF